MIYSIFLPNIIFENSEYLKNKHIYRNSKSHCAKYTVFYPFTYKVLIRLVSSYLSNVRTIHQITIRRTIRKLVKILPINAFSKSDLKYSNFFKAA